MFNNGILCAMNKHHIAKVKEIEKLTSDTFRCKLQLKKMPTILAGQFLNIKVPNGKFLLRRPFAIYDFDIKAKTVDFAFYVKGGGTEALSKLKVGEEVDVLLPLGNSFPQEFNGKKIMLIGGGIGVFPLLRNCYNAEAYSFLGFRSKQHAILLDDFKKLSKELHIATDDGSLGEKGFVTNLALKEVTRIKPDVIFCCGPHVMFGAVKKLFADVKIPIYISTEERMACGFGVCLCCNLAVTTMTNDKGQVKNSGEINYARVCCDGPVFKLEEVAL